jgi:hypothetical protein
VARSSLKEQYHEIVCELRPFVSSLGLNNMPRISFKLVKPRIKNIWRFKQGASRCKMAGAGFPCFAKLRTPTPRFATIKITTWQSALDRAADCQPPPSGVIRALRAVQAFGIPLSNSVLRLLQSAARQFSLWQSAWKTPRYANTDMNLSAEFSKRGNSSSRHFTLRGPLFELSYIFDARL